MKITLPDLAVVGVIFSVAAWVAYAEVVHQKSRTTEELVKILAERQIAEDAEKEGEKKLRKKLCVEGKLKGEDCAEVDD